MFFCRSLFKQHSFLRFMDVYGLNNRFVQFYIPFFQHLSPETIRTPEFGAKVGEETKVVNGFLQFNFTATQVCIHKFMKTDYVTNPA